MTQPDTASTLLEAAYDGLGLRDGALLDATDRPRATTLEEWVGKGQWLSLAKAANAEKVFFVGDDPVLVFARVASVDDDVVRRQLNRTWCMARPRRLFLATPGELVVFDLARPPARHGEPLADNGRLLATLRSVAEVQTELRDYRRELLETGHFPEESRFGDERAPADRTLIRDLKILRDQLMASGLDGNKGAYAHALIGRSIFIRYLEDRSILPPAYYTSIAARQRTWRRALEGGSATQSGLPSDESLYLRVLSDKAFTYALFEELRKDFNGDVFPVAREEQSTVTRDHLDLLQSFLRGTASFDGPPLFFFAYDFSVVPIDLISSIYENFYHSGDREGKDPGVHYTRGALVEFVLSKVLTPDRLSRGPRIIDPACGSGVFLVEAFRRIVRYRQHKAGRRLRLDELKRILREQIAGIEINPEAVRVAAFSLYLAMLHYVEPHDIWRDKRLPRLKYDAAAGHPTEERFDNLLGANAFRIESDIADAKVRNRFLSNCADVVVGNPPWGAPDKNDPPSSHEAARAAYAWCNQRERAPGDKELSQAFIHRALDMLRDGGVAGLLVSTGVFFKDQANSRRFRRQWLTESRIDHVVNFATVRDLWWEESVAPFASVVFERTMAPPADHRVEYWSAKKTPVSKQPSSVVMSQADRRLVRQRDLLDDDRLWKVYWWGNHHDCALVRAIAMEPRLDEARVNGARLVQAIGRGLEGGSRAPSEELRRYQLLPTASIRRYGPVDRSQFVPAPATRGREGELSIYDGVRILIKHGPQQKAGSAGTLVATLATEPFCVKHAVHGIRFEDSAADYAKCVLAVLWSSLARYYLWMTSGSWGMWHHKISMDDISRLPVCLPRDPVLTRDIVEIVDGLLNWAPLKYDMIDHPDGLHEEDIARKTKEMEQELDEAVFDLYDLTDGERDLIRDMCEIGLEFFYRHADSAAVQPVPHDVDLASGVLGDLACPQRRAGICSYLRVFLGIWNRELAGGPGLRWRLICPERRLPMLAITFTTRPKGELGSRWDARSDDDAFREVLRILDDVSVHHDGSKRVFIDGMVRVVTDADIIIIKRNELRLWTRSAAREDAEATLTQAMHLGGRRTGGIVD